MARKVKPQPKPKPKRKNKPGAGRPKLVFDAATVGRLASIDCTMSEIAAVLGCSVDTLERNYAEVIRAGREKGTASLKRKQVEVAMKGNTMMLIWLGKQRLGQREKTESFHSWKNPFDQMTDEQLKIESEKLRELESKQQKFIAPTPQPENQNEVIDLESTDAGRNYKPKLA